MGGVSDAQTNKFKLMIKKHSKVFLKTCISSFFSRLNFFYKFYNNIHAKDGKIVQIIISSQVAWLSSIGKSVTVYRKMGIILNFPLFFITRKMKSKSEIPIWNEVSEFGLYCTVFRILPHAWFVIVQEFKIFTLLFFCVGV